MSFWVGACPRRLSLSASKGWTRDEVASPALYFSLHLFHYWLFVDFGEALYPRECGRSFGSSSGISGWEIATAACYLSARTLCVTFMAMRLVWNRKDWRLNGLLNAEFISGEQQALTGPGRWRTFGCNLSDGFWQAIFNKGVCRWDSLICKGYYSHILTGRRKGPTLQGVLAN